MTSRIQTYDDKSRTFTLRDGDGTVLETRPYAAEENAGANSRLTEAALTSDIEARLARIEAKLWPAAPTPTVPTDAPAFSGVWPNGGLVLDKGTVYRNVSGVSLTSSPSDFPGAPSQWTHLFVVALAKPVDPPVPGVLPWNKDTRYEVGAKASKGGRIYQAKVAHGAEYQGTWAPPLASVWNDIGAA